MNMQTGFGGGGGDSMMEQYIETMTNLMLPVIEKSTLLAAEYSKACGRDTLLSEDMKYAMRYCVMYTVGDTIGPSFPDIYDEVESDYSDEEIDVDSLEDCPPFERYSGSDPVFLRVNEAYDNWDVWVPQNPTEELLKNAVNSNEHMGT
jgi:hypothetical protein|tara:strand:- start:9321 stop:9764 length:444 start_codon:yes stop_codon:yes gene_type:complete